MKMYEFLEDIVKQLEFCGYKTPDGLHDLKDSSTFHALKGMAVLEKAAVESSKLAKYEEKFLIINLKHIAGKGYEKIQKLHNALEAFELPKNKYYACNADEPYAPQVLDIILKGEAAKEEAAAESARRV